MTANANPELFNTIMILERMTTRLLHEVS